MPLATYKDLCIDAVDVPTLGWFWADALALDLGLHDDGDAELTDATDGNTIWLSAVPEPVTVKQRVHLDVFAHHVDDVLALGDVPEDLVSFPWKVLRDPEGSEWCVFECEELSERRLTKIVVDCADSDPITTWWADLLGEVRRDDEQGRFSWVWRTSRASPSSRGCSCPSQSPRPRRTESTSTSSPTPPEGWTPWWLRTTRSPPCCVIEPCGVCSSPSLAWCPVTIAHPAAVLPVRGFGCAGMVRCVGRSGRSTSAERAGCSSSVWPCSPLYDARWSPPYVRAGSRRRLLALAVVTLAVVTLAVVTLAVVTLAVVTLAVVTLAVVTLAVVTLAVVTLAVVTLAWLLVGARVSDPVAP